MQTGSATSQAENTPPTVTPSHAAARQGPNGSHGGWQTPLTSVSPAQHVWPALVGCPSATQLEQRPVAAL
jgi:hypothetical protein